MNVAILLSGGVGTRLNSNIPKQYIEVNEKMIITYSLEVIIKHPLIDKVVIVADEKYRDSILGEIGDVKCDKEISFAEPGKNRQMSIYNALICCKEDAPYSVFIHDAARPNITGEMISCYIDALDGHDGVLPVLPMKDTVYEVKDGKVTSLLKRENIYAGQAPEVFRYDRYVAANEKLIPDKILSVNGSTEPAFMAGMDIITVTGSENNYKITTDADLDKFVKSKVI